MENVVELKFEDRIAWLTMNDADHFNCLSEAMCHSLISAIDEAYASECVGIIFSHYAENGQHRDAAEWSDTVLAIPDLAPAIRRNMRAWRIRSSVSCHRPQAEEARPDVLSSCMPRDSSWLQYAF